MAATRTGTIDFMSGIVLQLRRLTLRDTGLASAWPRLSPLLAVAGIIIALVAAAPVAAQPFNLPWISDRTLHMAAHLVVWNLVGCLLTLGLHRWWWLAWPIGLLLAAGEELHQGLVPGRTVDLHDWLLNAAAVTAAVLLVGLLRFRRSAAPTRGRA